MRMPIQKLLSVALLAALPWAVHAGVLDAAGPKGWKEPSPDLRKPAPLRDVPCVGCAAPAAVADPAQLLSTTEVGQVIAQAVAQARASNAVATIAVTDRVGNVLAVYRMSGPVKDVTVSTTAPGEPSIDGGLEGIVLPASVGGDALAAIAKAVTGAYLSSDGNAFTTRTASQIVQQNFNPGERNQPSGPLFGVQFSQLACSDFVQKFNGVAADSGPKRSPLGLSADPGGLPIYKGSVLVGGVGVLADGRYSADPRLTDIDDDLDERIALAATSGFAPPDDIRADRITVDGKTLRYTDARASDVVAAARGASFAALGAGDGSLLPVPGYTTGTLTPGTAFGHPDSGVRPADGGAFAGRDAFVFVDALDQPRFAPIPGTEASGALSVAEVTSLLDSALEIANRARAQIRRPLGSQARVTISVVDTAGTILGIVRTRDAPVFGADVSLQKARTATFMSSPLGADFIENLTEPTAYLDASLAPRRSVDLRTYGDQLRDFFGPDALTGDTAFSVRATGNIARPFFPDDLLGEPNGPLSKPAGEWSVFSTGFQLDLAMNGIIQHVGFTAGLPGFTADTPANCVGVQLGAGTSTATNLLLANGLQIFPGGVPIYRGNTLIGGIGVSGDGIDQDDMISFLGLYYAAQRTGSINHASADTRADRLTPADVRLRYVQCPFAPFLDSNAQNVCAGK